MISKRNKVVLLIFLLGLALFMLLNLYSAPLVTRAGLIALNRLGFEKVSFSLSAPTFAGATLSDVSFQRRINESRHLFAEGLAVKLTYDPLRSRELTSMAVTGGVFKLERVAAKAPARDGEDVLTVLQGLPVKELTLENVALVFDGGKRILVSGYLRKGAAKSLTCEVSMLEGEHRGVAVASLVDHTLTAHASYAFQKSELFDTELTGSFDSKGIELRGPTNIGTLKNHGEFVVLHSFLEGTGHIKLHSHQVPAVDLVRRVNSIIPKGLPPTIPSLGTISFDVAYRWGETQGAEGKIAVQDVDIIFDELSLKDVDASIPVRWNHDALDVSEATVLISKVDFGIEIANVVATFSVSDKLVKLKSAKATAFGGTVSAGPANFGAEATAWTVPVEFHGISLDKLSRVYPQERIVASGSVGGRFLLSRSHEGVSIDEGHLAAESSGGTINYFPGEDADPGKVSELALGALSDFRYDALDAAVELLPSGELTLKTQMAGNNPGWQGGRRVEFNINLQQNLHDLLRSLRLTAGKSSELNTAVQEALSSK